jgi:hypothetical protein
MHISMTLSQSDILCKIWVAIFLQRIHIAIFYEPLLAV